MAENRNMDREVEKLREVAAEVAAHMETLQPLDSVHARYLASAKRDIAGGFRWAERAITGEMPV